MKLNKSIISLSLIPLLTLSGCTHKNDITIEVLTNVNIIYDESKTSFADYTTSLSTDDINDKLDNLESFILILYSDTCSVCNEVKPYIIDYICSNQYVFYGVGIYDYENTALKEALDRIHKFDSLAAPRIFFVSNGNELYTQNGFNKKERNANYIKTTCDYYIN